MLTEHDSLYAARIVNAAYQDKVIVGSAEDRIQNLTGRSWSKLSEDALCIRLSAFEARMGNSFN